MQITQIPLKLNSQYEIPRISHIRRQCRFTTWAGISETNNILTIIFTFQINYSYHCSSQLPPKKEKTKEKKKISMFDKFNLFFFFFSLLSSKNYTHKKTLGTDEPSDQFCWTYLSHRPTQPAHLRRFPPPKGLKNEGTEIFVGD